ncbi:MAG: Hpt domain-containing protein [Clostridiales bacterium]|nr:Hpt domain-containing protein [Clostridiales bacterium]
MNKIIEELINKGCEMEATRNRFMGDDDFYVDCLKQMLEDEGFENLGIALKQHQIKEAFEYSHMLKGVVSNLGITSLFNILVEIVEPLRMGNDIDLQDEYQRLLKERDTYIQIAFEQ